MKAMACSYSAARCTSRSSPSASTSTSSARDSRRWAASSSARLGRVPAVGDVFEVNGLHIEVLEAERRRVNKVRVRKLEGAPVVKGNHEERA